MAILNIGRDSCYSIGARRIGQLYSSGEPQARGTNKAGMGVYLLDRIGDALERAGGDPEKASAICGIEAREIAKIQQIRARAEAESEAEITESRRAVARERKGTPQRPVTDADVATLIAGAAASGSYLKAGRSLGWSESRVWRVHKRGLRTGAIARKAVRA